MFLSIGYSTCHWCHVMAHESFEDETVAEAITGDDPTSRIREERPDVTHLVWPLADGGHLAMAVDGAA